jgi:hypothetical protein
MPTATDLVTDLPADFEVFGQAVDTDFVDLLGGTTGQILSKTSATDLDFTWINNDQGDITGVTAGTGITGGGTSGAVTITNDMATTITASGDIVVGTGSGTYDNLPIGTTGQLLTADTTVSPYKVKWATPAAAASGLNLIATASFSGSTSVSVNNCFSATYTNYLLVVQTTSGSTNTTTLKMRVGGVDASTGYFWGYYRLPLGVASPTFSQFGAAGSQTSATIQTFDTNSILLMNFARPFLANKTSINWHMTDDQGSGQYAAGGVHQNNSTSYDGFTLTSDLAPTGNYYVYGYGN